MMIIFQIKIRWKWTKRSKNEDAKADPSQDGRNYGIDILNIGKAANESDENS